MVKRLQALLEHPLDPGLSRAMLVLALAAGTGFAIVALLGGIGGRSHTETQAARTTHPLERDAVERTLGAPVASSGLVAGQDAQDRLGTPAHRRAGREVAGRRALQHVPWRGGEVLVELVGAKDGRAVLGVVGPSLAATRRGWNLFLRRFHDDGHAYLPRFRARGDRRAR